MDEHDEQGNRRVTGSDGVGPPLWKSAPAEGEAESDGEDHRRAIDCDQGFLGRRSEGVGYGQDRLQDGQARGQARKRIPHDAVCRGLEHGLSRVGAFRG